MPNTGIKFSIDTNALGLIIDERAQRPIATGFIFLRSDWVITAKHVVEVEPGGRDLWKRVLFRAMNGTPVPARVLAASPETDVCILQLDVPSACERPLLPGNETLATSNGVIYAGYCPSKSAPKNQIIVVARAHAIDVQERERRLVERVLHFDTSEMEGGFSGGPVFGDGGAVVGVLINLVTDPLTVRGRATSTEGVLRALRFDVAVEWKV